jgi:hypothetical protein
LGNPGKNRQYSNKKLFFYWFSINFQLVLKYILTDLDGLMVWDGKRAKEKLFNFLIYEKKICFKKNSNFFFPKQILALKCNI